MCSIHGGGGVHIITGVGANGEVPHQKLVTKGFGLCNLIDYTDYTGRQKSIYVNSR